MSVWAKELAARLRAAYVGQPAAPLRDGLEPNDGDGTCRIQSINTAYWAAGGQARGWPQDRAYREIRAAAWLARTFVLRGEGLRAGDVVLTGALGPMVALTQGVQVRAQIGGVGNVSFAFRGDAA